MAVIAGFSKNLIYNLGGAEKSLLEILKDKSNHGDHVLLVAASGVASFNAQHYLIDVPDSMEIALIRPKKLFTRFFYNEYLYNREIISKFFKNLEADSLYAQNLWAPAAINAFKGESVYFIRDEGGMNVSINYYAGIKRLGKFFYNLMELPGYKAFYNDNIKAINQADRVVANSKYMAACIKARFGREAEVIYPFVDKVALVDAYAKVKSDVLDEDKGIVMLGDDKVKGIDILTKLALRFPGHKFYVFGRSISSLRVKGNISYMPWCKKPEDAYKYANLVIVPSLWNEAFGRVAVEALALNLPVIVSNKGGLPEAVGGDVTMIASNFQEFVKKINERI